MPGADFTQAVTLGGEISATPHNDAWDNLEDFLNPRLGGGLAGELIICDATGNPRPVAASGDLTVSEAGVFTLDADVRGAEYDEDLPEVTATDTGSLEDEGGPSVTLTVPTSGLVEIFVAADLKHSTGGANYARVGLIRDGVAAIFQNLISSNSTSYETKYTAPEQTLGEPLGENYTGGWLVFPDTAGAHTYSLRYGISGSGTGTFRNRKLWARTVPVIP